LRFNSGQKRLGFGLVLLAAEGGGLEPERAEIYFVMNKLRYICDIEIK